MLICAHDAPQVSYLDDHVHITQTGKTLLRVNDSDTFTGLFGFLRLYLALKL